MADIVGLVASVLQLVDTVTKARGYIHNFIDAPKDQQRLLLEIQNLEPLVKELDTRIKDVHAAGHIGGTTEFEEPLVQLKRTMERLTKKLDSTGISKFSSRVAWPLWGKEDVEEGLSAIERFKSLLIAWLGMDIWKSAQNVNVSIKDVAEEQRVDHGYIIRSVKQLAQEHGVAHSETMSIIKDATEEQKTDHTYIAKSIRDVARNQERYHNSDERGKLLEWFSPLNFFVRQADIFNAWQPGTGEWLLEADAFKKWKSGSGKILWCRGMPGAGKTVLASLVVETLRAEQKTAVAALYINHQETEVQSPSNLLAGLWRQLVFGKPISPDVHHLYAKHGEQRTRPSLEDTYSVLRSTISEQCNVFIIVDALDEYPEEQRNTLLRRLAALGPNVNLMLTSRLHIRIDHIIATCEVEILGIRAREDDIRLYVDEQISKSSRLVKHITNCTGLREEIELRIVLRSDGMFLLAKFHIDSLTTKHTLKEVRTTLANMPDNLNKAYDHIITRINRQSEDDRNLAQRVLSWIFNAKRTLRPDELREALAVEPGTAEFDPDNLLEIDTILSVCAGLVIVDTGDDFVRLIHYTTQDYLERIQADAFPTAHTEITSVCITYLSFDAFSRNIHAPKDTRFPKSLLDYSVDYCLAHARGQPETDIPQLIESFLENGFVWRKLWNWRHSYEKIPASANALWIAAVFHLEQICRHQIMEKGVGGMLQEVTLEGLTDVVRILVQNGANVDAPEGEYDSPLQAASVRGHDEIIGLLLAHGADVNLRGSRYGTALQMAAFFGHKQSVRLLIYHGANINAEAGRYGTALYAAATQCNEEMLQMLLKHGAEVNEKGGQFGTALGAAVCRGFDVIARALVEHDADLNAETTLHGRPVSVLQRAISTGPEAIARLLIEKGAAINAVGSSGTALDIAVHCRKYEVVRLLLVHGAKINGTTLCTASSEGNHELVRILLEHGTEVEEDSRGAALHAALLKGHKEIVCILIEYDADVNAKDGQHRTVLQAAITKGNEAIFRLLIDHGADVNANAGRDGTALYITSHCGNYELVRTLLERGAKVNAMGGRFPAAIHAALSEGHDEIVHLLIEHSADVNAKDEQDRSALQAAIAMGNEQIARLLVQHGADTNAKEGRPGDGTPLYIASYRGSYELVQTLLEHGAEVNAMGGQFPAAIHAALSEGNDGIVRLLIEHDADINAKDGQHRTVLQAAITKGNEAISTLLVERGADVNASAGRDGTALYIASHRGSYKLVRLLLEHGAEVNVTGEDILLPLHAALLGGHNKIVRLLIEHNANVNAKDEQAGSVLQAAISMGEEAIAMLLIEHGTNVNTKAGKDGMALCIASRRGSYELVRVLLKCGADVNDTGGGNTALQAASWAGHGDIIRLLIEHGTDVNGTGGVGTALRAASGAGHEDIVRLLIKHGADVNVGGGWAGSPLWTASCKGRKEVVKLLLEHGADVSFVGGWQNCTPFEAAFRAGHKDIAQLRIQHGAIQE